MPSVLSHSLTDSVLVSIPNNLLAAVFETQLFETLLPIPFPLTPYCQGTSSLGPSIHTRPLVASLKAHTDRKYMSRRVSGGRDLFDFHVSALKWYLLGDCIVDEMMASTWHIEGIQSMLPA